MVGHCHFFLLFVFVGILDIVWFGLKSLCGHVVFFALGHFWIVEFFGIVKYRQCWSSMKLCIVCSLWYCWMNFDLIFMGMKSWEFDVYGNFVGMCRPYFHGYGNSMWVLFSWVWNFFFFFFFFLLDICLSQYWMEYIWRWGIFGLIGLLFRCHGIWICEMAFRVRLIFLRGIILLVGILEWVFWNRAFYEHLNDWLSFFL